MMEQPDSNSRLTWHTVRLGDACLINYKGEWGPGVVRKRGRKAVKVAYEGHILTRPYQELRRKVNG